MCLNELTNLMHITGDENRMKILCLIFNKKNMCVSDIANTLKISIASASHHLKVMSGEGILVPNRNGKYICYSVSKNPIIGDLKKLICKYQ